MDTNLIKVGEKTYPVKYGFNALRLFCNASGIRLQELEKIGENISIDHAINLVWAGMKDGSRADKQAFALDADAIAALLDDDIPIIPRGIELVVASFLNAGAEEKI